MLPPWGSLRVNSHVLFLAQDWLLRDRMDYLAKNQGMSGKRLRDGLSTVLASTHSTQVMRTRGKIDR